MRFSPQMKIFVSRIKSASGSVASSWTSKVEFLSFDRQLLCLGVCFHLILSVIVCVIG